MFDAKSILEGLVRNAAPAISPQQGSGGLGDILGEILKGGTGSNGGALPDILGELGRKLSPSAAPASNHGGGGGLGDVLSELQRQLGQASVSRQAAPSGNAGAPGGASAGFDDILAQIKDTLGQSGGALPQSGGGILDILGQVLAQATQGAKEGAGRIGAATGATSAAREAIGAATGGQTPEELLSKLKELVGQNPFAAGTAAVGLGGLILGTRTGRAIAGSAARIGALALIGGLAYKAFQNYQAGRPLITGATLPEAAPPGSGFEPGAVTNEAATHYIQAMVAAAAADGRIDSAEQEKIIAGLKQAGLDAAAEEFLANELNNPQSVEDLAAAVGSPEEAIQLYTAARIAIEPDSAAEKQFLARLANALGVDQKLARHVEAMTQSAAA